MSHVKPADAVPLRVLDVGCGNGRFAGYLTDDPTFSTPANLDYLGIDSSQALLEHASSANAGVGNVRFEIQDILELEDRCAPGSPRFDLIVAFGVLHHIPDAQTRRSFLKTLASLLSEHGVLIVTAWQFGSSERFTSRRIEWAHYNESADDPIDERQLDEGDYLLRFGSSPLPRYCHFASKDELRDLFTGCAVTWLDEFGDDGKSHDLNQYAVVTPK
jgi:SAM-dependent methyltransferase